MGWGSRGAPRLPQLVVAVADRAVRARMKELTLRVVAHGPGAAGVEALDDNQQPGAQRVAAECRVGSVDGLQLVDEPVLVVLGAKQPLPEQTALKDTRAELE